MVPPGGGCWHDARATTPNPNPAQNQQPHLGWPKTLTSSVPLQLGEWGVQRIPRGARPAEPEQLRDRLALDAAMTADTDGSIQWVWWPEADYLVTPTKCQLSGQPSCNATLL